MKRASAKPFVSILFPDGEMSRFTAHPALQALRCAGSGLDRRIRNGIGSVRVFLKNRLPRRRFGECGVVLCFWGRGESGGVNGMFADLRLGDGHRPPCIRVGMGVRHAGGDGQPKPGEYHRSNSDCKTIGDHLIHAIYSASSLPGFCVIYLVWVNPGFRFGNCMAQSL